MKKNLIYIALATTLLASCSSDVIPTVTNKDTLKAMGVSVGIETKAIRTGTSFAKDETIGVFVVGTGYTSTKTVYTCPASGDWTTEAGKDIYLSNVDADAYGFYPSSLTPNMTDLNIPVEVKATQTISTTATDQVDYLYAKAAQKVSNADSKNKVALAFKHSMCQLNFIVNKDVTYVGGDGKLASIELSSGTDKGFVAGATGTMSLSDGTFTFADDVSKLTFDTSANPVTANASDAITTVSLKTLVAPVADLAHADPNQIKLTAKVDGKDMVVVLPVSTVTKWEAAHVYTYTLTLKGTKLIVASDKVTIEEWDKTTPAVPADIN